MTKNSALQRQMERLLQDWQEILFLRDWTIDVIVCRRPEMPKEVRNSYGAVNHFRHEGVGRIYILDPADALSRERPVPYDPEECLVHELLHLVPGHLDHRPESGSPADDDAERGIDQLARALVRLKRLAAK